MKPTRAKERENARQRRYNEIDLLQPFNEKGKRNRKFMKVYGEKLYGKPGGTP